MLIAGCSPAVQPIAEPSPAAYLSTESPAVEEPAEVVESETSPTVEPAPYEPEARMVALEWPSQMRLGDSDIVRLALVPSEDSYVLEAEFYEHQILQQDMDVPRPAGYDLWASARLDGAGFTISPVGDQPYYLAPGQALNWRWSLSPLAPGQQRLSVSLLLRWTPLAGSPGRLHEALVFSEALDVRVRSYFGLSRRQAMTGGVLGVLAGISLFGIGLVGWLGEGLRRSRPAKANPALKIEAGGGIALSSADRYLLQRLFWRYQRVVLENEFLSGYSGARTLLALPVQREGRADAYTIVKINTVAAIEREYQNYTRFVKHTLPPVTARVQEAPVYTPGPPEQGAIQYTFIAAPGQMPLSLRQVLLAKPDPSLLEKLFATFAPGWWRQRQPYVFRMAQEYDPLLPVHLVVEPGSGSSVSLDGRAPENWPPVKVGDTVKLKNFHSGEIRPDGASRTLRAESSPGLVPIRVRWLSAEPAEGRIGRVVATRHSLLSAYQTDLPGYSIPDPLDYLEHVLARTVQGTRSIIHGDLNMENILVGPGDFIWLIDFAETREGHPLLDFAHLEAELIAHIIAPQVRDSLELYEFLNENQTTNHQALAELCAVIHRQATYCLANPEEMGEYWQALYITCLGALKFVNLDKTQKQALWLMSAILSRRL